MSSQTNLQNARFLFLDRDGVINRRIVGGYVTQWDEFVFLPEVPEALAVLSKRFERIVVITNQQGVGKGLMSLQDLETVHRQMTEAVASAGGRIDAIFFCTHVAGSPDNCRKPGIQMGLMAQARFPEIDFSQSIMVGDSPSDMEFAARLGMVRVFIHNPGEEMPEPGSYDLCFGSLMEFTTET